LNISSAGFTRKEREFVCCNRYLLKESGNKWMRSVAFTREREGNLAIPCREFCALKRHLSESKSHRMLFSPKEKPDLRKRGTP